MYEKILISIGILAVATGVGLFVLLPIPVLILVVLFIFLLFVIVFLKSPELGVLGIIAVRMILDRFAAFSISFMDVSLNLSALFGVALIAFAVGYFFLMRENPFRRRVTWPLWIFIGIATVSIGFSQERFEAFTDSIRFLNYGIIFAITLSVLSTPQRVQRFLAWFPMLMLIPGIVALGNLAGFGGYEVGGYGSIPIGTFLHPNYLSYASLIVLPVLAFQWVRRPDPKARALIAAAAACGVWFVFATHSLGAAYTLFSVLVFFFLIRMNSVFILIPFALLVFSILFPFMNYTAGQHGKALTQQPVFLKLIEENTEEGSFLWRIRNWESMTGYVQEKPLFGWGAGTYKRLRAQVAEYETDLDATEAHNDYLHVQVELGALGLAAFVSMWAVFLAALARPMKRIRGALARRDILSLLTLALLFGMTTAMSVENIFKGASVMWPLFSLIAAAIAYQRFLQSPMYRDAGTLTRKSL